MARLGHFIRDTRGATAVEFALVGSLFILSTLFIIVAGAILYIGEVVDYATNAATRDIMTGTAQASAINQQTFTQSLCNRLPSGIQCSNLIVNLYTVTKASGPAGYYNYVNADQSKLTIPALTPGAGQFSLGGRGDYQYLQVIYPLTFLPPAFAAMLSGGATFNGKPAYLAISTAAFRNEQY
jgi:Flp pilus assembly protein TadG